MKNSAGAIFWTWVEMEETLSAKLESFANRQAGMSAPRRMRAFARAPMTSAKKKEHQMKNAVENWGIGLLGAGWDANGGGRCNYMIFRRLSPFFTYLTPFFTYLSGCKCLISAMLNEMDGYKRHLNAVQRTKRGILTMDGHVWTRI